MQYEYHDEIAPLAEDEWKRLMERKQQWRSEYYAQWIIECQDPLEEMAKEYVTRCDAYDGPTSDAYTNPWWHGNVNRHAYQVRRELCAQWSITERQFHDAIVAYQRTRR